MKIYNKKVTISLTEEDFNTLVKMAEEDRRTNNQMASMLVEDALATTKNNDTGAS